MKLSFKALLTALAVVALAALLLSCRSPAPARAA